jgi:hypothetical protein
MIRSFLIFGLAILVSITTAQADYNFEIQNLSNSSSISKSSNPTEFIQVRRGGGGRRSFGGSRRSSSSRSKSRSSSTKRSKTGSRSLSSTPSKTPSFGGKRITQQQATAKYGTPRKQQTVQSKNQLGESVNYRMNSYGGFSSGLMTGYMMGNMSWWMWAPAMVYSKPYYVTNENGEVDVYPPTFSFSRLLFWLIVIGVIVFIIRQIIKARKQGNATQNYSSFG